MEGRRYFLRPGDVILTNNSELHKTVIREGRHYDRYVIWIRPEYLESMNRQFPDFSFSACFDSTARFHYNLVRPGQEMFAACLQLLEKLMAMDGGALEGMGVGVLRTCYLMELFVFLNFAQKDTELTPGIHVISNPKIDEVVFYINNHLREDLTLDTLAKQFFVSKFYLSRLFKECMGISLHQYIMNKRLLFAKRLLLAGMEPYMACGEAGFGDYSHFSRSFKRYFGVAPREIN